MNYNNISNNFLNYSNNSFYKQNKSGVNNNNLKPVFNNYEKKTKLNFTKKKPMRSYSILKNIFFADNYQKFPSKKIEDYQKEIIAKELENKKLENDDNLKEYCKDFIKNRILPLFEKKDLSYNHREVLKYNIYRDYIGMLRRKKGFV